MMLSFDSSVPATVDFGSNIGLLLAYEYSRPRAQYLASTPLLSSSGIFTYSAVQTMISSDIRKACEELYPDGRCDGNIYRTEHVDIALDGFCTHMESVFCGPMSWYCREENVFGIDLVRLFAFWHKQPYDWALEKFRDHYKLDDKKIESLSIGDIPGWMSEHQPLRCDFEGDVSAETSQINVNSKKRIYRNTNGTANAVAEEWNVFGGNSVTTYKFLCRRKKDGRLRWMAISPGPIFPLFNADLIARNPAMPIMFVGSEAEAERFDPRAIYSTVPGGMINLDKADLTLVAGRKVDVQFGPRDIQRGLLVREKLRDFGAVQPRFCVGMDDQWAFFSEIETYAATRNIELTPVTGGRLTPAKIVIQKPGEPIPGGDLVRQMLLRPIVQEGELIWIFADAKAGKTFFSIAISHAVAVGNARVGKWGSDEAYGVLHVDGEMSPDGLTKAIRMIMVGAGNKAEDPPFSRLCAKSLEGGSVNLEDAEVQEAIENSLGGIKLLVLDNYVSLTRNNPNTLKSISPWIKKLTRSGVAVIFIDHTNRDGDLCGTIDKKRMADLTISLTYPDEDAKADGRLLVEFPEPRRLYGEDIKEFELRKVSTEATEQSPASFRFELVESPQAPEQSIPKRITRMALVVFAKDRSLTYTEIERQFEIPLSTAHGDYEASKKLTGADREAFELELRRLTAEHQSGSD